MTLSIITTHYKEPWRLVKQLFDSLSLQRGIDWKDIEILLIQDGEEGALGRNHFVNYGLPITMHTVPHGGVSKARNYGLDVAEGNYVMWCDCDDMFHSAYGLYQVFSAIQEDPDIVNSGFIEESAAGDTYKMFAHDSDITFVHGKAFKKQFLLDNEIRFPEDIHKHEDGVAICLAFNLTRNVKYIRSPFYTWCWNPESVMRKDGVAIALLESYPELMKARIRFMTEMQKRGKSIDRHVAKTIFTAYYDFQRTTFTAAENIELIRKAARAVKQFYSIYKDNYLANEGEVLAEIANQSRSHAYETGMLMEQMTIKQFLKMITELNGK